MRKMDKKDLHHELDQRLCRLRALVNLMRRVTDLDGIEDGHTLSRDVFYACETLLDEINDLDSAVDSLSLPEAAE